MADYLLMARDYIEKECGSEYAIDTDSVQDLDLFYMFSYQSKKFIETRDLSFITIGQGPVIISKSDKRIFPYGSGFTDEMALIDLQNRLTLESEIKKQIRGYDMRQRYDISITEVYEMQALPDIFIKHKISYIVSEVIGESIYRSGKNYTRKLLEERLRNLPTVFTCILEKTGLFLFSDLLKRSCCEFELLPHVSTQKAVYIAKASEEDLKIEW